MADSFIDLGGSGRLVGHGSPSVVAEHDEVTVADYARLRGARVTAIEVAAVRSRSEFADRAASAFDGGWTEARFLTVDVSATTPPPGSVVFIRGLHELLQNDLRLALHVVVLLHRWRTALRQRGLQFEPVYVFPSNVSVGAGDVISPSSGMPGIVTDPDSSMIFPDGEASEFLRLREGHGWHVAKVDVSTVASTVDFFSALKKSLWFPSWCGSSWDSMDDAFIELREAWAFPMLLYVRGLREMLSNNLQVGLQNVIYLDETVRGYLAEKLSLEVTYPVS